MTSDYYSLINFANQCPTLSIDSIQSAMEINPSITTSQDINSGLSLLLISIEQENFKVAEYLLDKGADVNAKYAYGQSLLHIAVEKSNNKIINLLLERDINPNIKDDSGETPMHIAALNGEYKVIKLLLLYLANPFIKNNAGYYPIDYAKETNHVKSYNVLLGYQSRSSKNLSSIVHSISPLANKSICYDNQTERLQNENRKCSYFKSESKFKIMKLREHRSCIALPCLIDIKEGNNQIEASSYENVDNSTDRHRVLIGDSHINDDQMLHSNIQLYELDTEECTPSSKALNFAFQWNHTPSATTPTLTFNKNKERNTSINPEEKSSSLSQLNLDKDIFINGKFCFCLSSTNNNIDNKPQSHHKKSISLNNSHQSLKNIHQFQYEIINEELKQELSSLYSLLKEIQMEKYYPIFSSEGFDDINTLVSFIEQKDSFVSFASKRLNAIQQGDKARILIKLQESKQAY